jgi:putative spermidine/putrescine transport system ATP-binding protein
MRDDDGKDGEAGVVREVVYVGMVTRYVVDLDDGGELVAIRQNFEGAEEALGAQGERIRLAWRPEQSSVVGPRPEDVERGEEE